MKQQQRQTWGSFADWIRCLILVSVVCPWRPNKIRNITVRKCPSNLTQFGQKECKLFFEIIYCPFATLLWNKHHYWSYHTRAAANAAAVAPEQLKRMTTTWRQKRRDMQTKFLLFVCYCCWWSWVHSQMVIYCWNVFNKVAFFDHLLFLCFSLPL